MGWYGKLIGAVLGAIVGRGLLGAVIGLMVGHAYDRNAARPARPGGSPRDLRVAFFRATFEVMGHVAKADGRVTEQEIRAAREAMRRFALGEADTQRAMELFTAGKRADYPLEERLAELCGLAGERSDLCRTFVQIQLEAALSGEGLTAASRGVLGRVGASLGVSLAEFAAMEAMLRMRGAPPGARPDAGGRASAGEPLVDAYELLGVGPDASDAEVTLAFRRLLSQNHPDKLVANGLPESMVAAAHERTRQLIEAYERVKQRRGMK